MTAFKDYFSQQSDIYLKYRPNYPAELYAFLTSLAPEIGLAWDCGTGNGQAAIGLARHFDRVIATDPSEKQIRNAIANEKIDYLVETAEKNSIGSSTIDLLTVANALHWFKFDTFYNEVRRVLKINGIFAAWAYGIPTVNPEVDSIIKQYHDQTLNDYWFPENRLVEREYIDIPFPFELIESPQFFCERTFNLNELIGYLNTWSGTQRFINVNKSNPTDQLYQQLKEVWGDDHIERKLTWKLVLKVGRVLPH